MIILTVTKKTGLHPLFRKYIFQKTTEAPPAVLGLKKIILWQDDWALVETFLIFPNFLKCELLSSATREATQIQQIQVFYY